MKPKKISQKLALNKATVASLTLERMLEIKGGLPLTSYDHIYYCYTLCNTGICCQQTLPPYPCPEPTGTCYTDEC